MSGVEEIAKVIQEKAKLGQKGLSIAEKVGGFFAKLFKEPAVEVSGMITDKLRFIRWKRMIEITDEVNAILAQRGIVETRAVTPKIALPIMEEASLEDNPDIRFLWNHLLANAMDPSFNGEIRYGFVDMIKNITGLEAKILNDFYNLLQKNDSIRPIVRAYNYSINKEQIIEDLMISEEEYAIAVNNLMRLQLISPAVIKSSGISLSASALSPTVSYGLGEKPTIFKGIDAITMTPLGVRFVEACIK